VSGRTSAPARVWQKHRHLYLAGGAAVSKLDSSLALGRAIYERWLGTEPDEIAAAEALRRFEPEHPSLAHLEVRFRRALQIKAMLADILRPEPMEKNDEEWRQL
jgi:hypothetical protein